MRQAHYNRMHRDPEFYKRWKAENAEKKAAYQRAYRKANPEKFVWDDAKRAAYQKRRARKKGAGTLERITSRAIRVCCLGTDRLINALA